MEEYLAQQEPEKSASEDLTQAETLNAALECLRAGKSPREFFADPAFQAGLKLHVQTSNAELDDDVREEIEQSLLEHFVKHSTPHARRASFGVLFARRFLIPVASMSLVAVLVVGVVQLLNSTPVPVLAPNTNNTNTPRLANTNGQPNINTGTEPPANTNTTPRATITGPTPPSVTTVLSDAQVNLPDIQTEVTDIDALKEDIEQSIEDLENLLKEVESLDEVNDFDAVLDEFNTI